MEEMTIIAVRSRYTRPRISLVWYDRSKCEQWAAGWRGPVIVLQVGRLSAPFYHFDRDFVPFNTELIWKK